MMEVKGRLVASIQQFVRKKFGPEGLEKWLDAISGEARLLYAFKIRESDWYDMKTYMLEPVAFVAQLFYNWNLQETGWQMGRFSAEQAFRGILRMFLKVGKPEFLVSKGPQFIVGYYRPSGIKVHVNERGHAVLRIDEFPEIDKTIEYRIGGWMQRGLEMNGCKDVNVDITRSLMKGDPYTEFRIQYKP